MEQWLAQTSFFQWMQAHPVNLYLCGFLVAFAETFAFIGIIVPGIVLLGLICVVAAQLHLNYFLLVLCIALGSFLSSLMSFEIGMRSRKLSANTWPFSRHPELLTQSENLLNQYGELALFTTRFIGPIRPLSSLSAGILKWNRTRFLYLEALIVPLWAVLYSLPFYALSRWQTDIFAHPLFWVLAALALIALFSLYRWQKRMLN